jgi:hypothetical protein
MSEPHTAKNVRDAAERLARADRMRRRLEEQRGLAPWSAIEECLAAKLEFDLAVQAHRANAIDDAEISAHVERLLDGVGVVGGPPTLARTAAPTRTR